MRAGGTGSRLCGLRRRGTVADVARSGFISPVSAALLELSIYIPLFSRYFASPIARLHRSSHSALNLRTRLTPLFRYAIYPSSTPPQRSRSLLLPISQCGYMFMHLRRDRTMYFTCGTHVNADNGGVTLYSLHHPRTKIPRVYDPHTQPT
jgi:hypothetical protein